MPSEASGGLQEQDTDARQNRKTSWVPIVVIIIAAAIVVVLAVNAPQNGSDRQSMTTTDSTFNSTAFLSGVERRIMSSTFRGGSASAFMGGVELDFRNATMEGNEAKIDVSALMGGIDIRVPGSWVVINRVSAILGGVDDNTTSHDGNKRLVIEGTVLMGGLDIKN